MRKTRLVLACLSVLSLTCSSYALANNRAGAISLRLGEGYYFFASKRHMENTTVPNMQVGYDFTDHWAAQAGVVLINANQRHGYGGDHVHGYIYSIDGVYHFQRGTQWEPYLMGGIGVTSLKPNNNDATNQGNVAFGGGVNYFLEDSIAVGADAKDIYALSGGKNDFMLTAGVTFLFGGASNQAEPYKGQTEKTAK